MTKGRACAHSSPLGRLGRRQYTGDVAAGRAFVPVKPRLVLDRGNPDHLVHRSLATRTGNGALLLRQVRPRMHFQQRIRHFQQRIRRNARRFHWLRGTFLLRALSPSPGTAQRHRIGAALSFTHVRHWRRRRHWRRFRRTFAIAHGP
jgi:hypothetical protein